MNTELLVKKILNCPTYLDMGNGKLSKVWKCSVEEVKAIKEEAKRRGATYHRVRNKPKKKAVLPKVLIFDIETAPMKAYVWQRWKENVYLDQTISEWFVLSWSAKWLYSDEIMSATLSPEEAILENDERIVKSLWELFDEATVVVGHNISGYDVPKMNSRFIVYGLNPPTPYFKVDTYEVAKRNFGFSSNKLDALATYFGIDTKLETSFELWKDCLEGKEGALKYMAEYNRKDVEITEAVYLRLRPYMKSHPNISLLTDRNCCCKCGSEKLKLLKDKYYYTSVSKYPLYQCSSCGTIVRGRKNIATRPQYVSVAK